METSELSPLVEASYWNTKDKEWVNTRKHQWEYIALAIGESYKSKKALSVIKQYFLKGKAPDWQKIGYSWPEKDQFRHLDLLCFLWLHPTSDPEILRELRDSYVKSSVIRGDDILAGQSLFISLQLLVNYPYIDKDTEFLPADFFGKEDVLFELLYENLDEVEFTALKRSRLCSFKKIFFKTLPFIELKKWLENDYEEYNYRKSKHVLSYANALDFYFTYLQSNTIECDNQVLKSKSLLKKTLKTIYGLRKNEFADSRGKFLEMFIDKMTARDYPCSLKDVWLEVIEEG